jgi:hypothetical protein
VTSSSLDEAGTLTNFPGAVDIQFSEPVLLTSVDPEDLRVNGVAATSISYLTPTSVRFHFASAFTGDGDYLLTLAEAGVTDIHGNTNDAWSTQFAVDSHGPTVTTTSVAEGALLATGEQTITVTLSEPIDTEQLTSDDFLLQAVTSGQAVAISNFAYDASTLTLTLTTPSLGEGMYTLTLRSGFYALRDLVGNSLDGNDDGTNGDNFTLGFGVDVGTVAYPPMVGLPPLGSMVYDPVIAGFIHAAGDVDTYTVSLGSGQLLTVATEVLSGALQLEISVRDADDDSLVATLAGNAGQSVALQALRNLSGDYKVEVRGLAGCRCVPVCADSQCAGRTGNAGWQRGQQRHGVCHGAGRQHAGSRHTRR